LEARHPLQTLRPGGALRANRARQAVDSRSPRQAGRSGLPGKPSLALLAWNAARSCCAGLTGGPLSTWCAGGTGLAGQRLEDVGEHARGKVDGEQRAVLDLLRTDGPRRDLVRADGIGLDRGAADLVMLHLGRGARFSADPRPVPGLGLDFRFRRGGSVRARRWFSRRDGDERADTYDGRGGGGR
jgi:hypothetical protein